ncbi:hypothetical protein [Pseudomonas akapageensis]|uniref:hypothetical protein n=1 Tax=Pseudomonas akapageensis TaxID=2609961 RepID=UPI0014093CE7|nr:hypothetical protein [Pseudomonas akapageensis]
MHENTETRRALIANGTSPQTAFDNSFYLHLTHRGQTPSPRFKVVPAGVGFFHITDHATGRVMGFRRSHDDACALARRLEYSN